MKPRKWRKLIVAGLAWTLLLLAGVFIVASWEVAGSFIAPVPSRVTWPAQLSPAPENMTFTTSDGVHLAGWWMSVPGSSRAVVLLHGIDANRYQMLDRARWLRGLGYNVLLYDARGHGESDRVYKGYGYRERADLLGALDWLQQRGMTSVACLGFSQGAATVLLTADQLPPSVRAVVVEASYDTLQDTVDDHFRSWTGEPSAYWGALVVPFAEWKLGFRLGQVSPLQQTPSLRVPVFFMAGSRDRLAPLAGVKRLFDAATAPKTFWLVEGAGHGDFYAFAGTEYRQRVGDFLAMNLGTASAGLSSEARQTPGVPPKGGTGPAPR